MPVILFPGNSRADKFPPYVEQCNQRVSEQNYMATNHARSPIEWFQQYIAIYLLFGIQTADLCTPFDMDTVRLPLYLRKPPICIR
jgi:phenylalanine ammonia-lyase